ncbi:DUF3618 domain-containing protein [Nocardia sp. NPDC050406]|uniref:DUF3618 domain-containing protein n=1 Tax=Nocardia sp. NPDC050406 TaxID=3364318 RepID=UPI00378BD8ED
MNEERHSIDPADAIRADRDEARQQLAETAAELAAKLDVQARAKDRVRAAEHTARTKVDQAKHKAEDTAAQVKSQAQSLAEQARQAAPEPVVHGGQRAVDIARNQPIPVAAAAALLALLLWLILRQRS